MHQLAIRILNAALIGLCAFQSAEVVNLVAAESLQPTPTYEAPEPPAEERARSEWEARKTILDRNLFGAKIIDDTPKEPEPIVEEKIEETKLPLVLEATIALSDGAESHAAIHDTRERKTMVVGVGDTIENYARVTVAQIERGRVLLNNSGRHEVLLLDESSVEAEIGDARSRSSRASTSRSSRSRTPRKARRPSSRARGADARAERLRELAEAAEGELTLEGITAEIERLRLLEEE